MNNENFIPEIQYNQIGDKTNVFLTLPDNLNKVIYEIDEPVFNSGVKCDYTHESPLSGNKSFENQQNFKIVNTSFVKLSDRTNVFYIYKNKNRVIVFREEFMVSGISDSEVIFNEDITKLIGENQVDNSDNDEKILIFEAEDSFRGYTAKYKYEIKIKDKMLLLNEYENNSLINSQKGKFINGKIYIEDDSGVSYQIEDDYFCIYVEGGETLRFPKTN